jgi:hypothetical protein
MSEAAMLVLLNGGTCEVLSLLSLRWYYLCTKCDDVPSRHLNNIKINISTICEATMLVLMVGGIYVALCWDGIRWHDINSKFHKNRGNDIMPPDTVSTECHDINSKFHKDLFMLSQVTKRKTHKSTSRQQSFLIRLFSVTKTINTNTPWPESASELYRPSDRHLLTKLVPTFCG